MESAEKGGRMSSPHVDEEKRGKATVYKGKKEKKEWIRGREKKKIRQDSFFGIWNLPTLKPSILA